MKRRNPPPRQLRKVSKRDYPHLAAHGDVGKGIVGGARDLFGDNPFSQWFIDELEEAAEVLDALPIFTQCDDPKIKDEWAALHEAFPRDQDKFRIPISILALHAKAARATRRYDRAVASLVLAFHKDKALNPSLTRKTFARRTRRDGAAAWCGVLNTVSERLAVLDRYFTDEYGGERGLTDAEREHMERLVESDAEPHA